MKPSKRGLGKTLIFALLGAVASGAHALEVPGPLVDTDWLAQNRDDVVILDARKDTRSFIRRSKGGGKVAGVQACGAKAGGGGKVSGHIPGSAMADWKVYAPTIKGKLHDELPGREAFQKLMQGSGVDQDSAVIISHRGEGPKEVAFATRLYWTLKYYGHDNVALLDGGVAKWAAEKRKVEYGRTRPRKGNWKAGTERRHLLATAEDVQKTIDEGGQIVNPLPQSYYLGLTLKKGVVPKRGHIATAKSMPLDVLVHAGPKGATLYPVEQLEKVARAVGVDSSKPVITHCNTGHVASLGWFVNSELLGNKQTRLYDGSMEEWSADDARPVVAFEME